MFLSFSGVLIYIRLILNRLSILPSEPSDSSLFLIFALFSGSNCLLLISFILIQYIKSTLSLIVFLFIRHIYSSAFHYISFILHRFCIRYWFNAYTFLSRFRQLYINIRLDKSVYPSVKIISVSGWFQNHLTLCPSPLFPSQDHLFFTMEEIFFFQ